MEFDLSYNMMEIFFVLLWFSFPSWSCLNLVIHWTPPLDFDPQGPLGAGDGGVLPVLWSGYHTLTQITRWIELWSPASGSSQCRPPSTLFWTLNLSCCRYPLASMAGQPRSLSLLWGREQAHLNRTVVSPPRTPLGSHHCWGFCLPSCRQLVL